MSDDSNHLYYSTCGANINDGNRGYYSQSSQQYSPSQQQYSPSQQQFQQSSQMQQQQQQMMMMQQQQQQQNNQFVGTSTDFAKSKNFNSIQAPQELFNSSSYANIVDPNDISSNASKGGGKVGGGNSPSRGRSKTKPNKPSKNKSKSPYKDKNKEGVDEKGGKKKFKDLSFGRKIVRVGTLGLVNSNTQQTDPYDMSSMSASFENSSPHHHHHSSDGGVQYQMERGKKFDPEYDVYDTKMTITFETTLAKINEGTDRLSLKRSIGADTLKDKYFTVQVKNIDKLLTQAVDMAKVKKSKNYSKVFILDSKVVQASNTSPYAVQVAVVEDPNNKSGAAGCFNRVISSDNKTPVMLNLPSGQGSIITSADNVFVVQDKEKLFNSKLMEIYGHTDLDYYEKSFFVYPSNRDYANIMYIRPNCSLIKIINDNVKFLMKECSWDGQAMSVVVEDEEVYQYPQNVVAVAAYKYDANIKPQFDNRIIDCTKPITFSVSRQDNTATWDLVGNDAFDKRPFNISVTLDIRYVFPESKSIELHKITLEQEEFNPRGNFLNIFQGICASSKQK